MLMIIFVLFTKTPLLIIVNEIVKVEWMLINKSILREKNNKCCVNILKW
jgi:hypothetical protein